METFGVPEENPAKEMIQVRLVHSMNSTVGKVMVSCISMALSDFYGVHADYHTRLSLHVRDPEDDTMDAASSIPQATLVDVVNFETFARTNKGDPRPPLKATLAQHRRGP
ncbi:hypothetical protein EUGRSUZ_C02432 [Eucalyptus grandis]|uniref:Uncharacterized protein n=2 Tax=Eucalyptus grandis TaxID=71139 RepID=A0ACC3LG08_EUCGR|nr:hypothetical protein EUGRSUZ_C02432 [Eucalyptus grandis]